MENSSEAVTDRPNRSNPFGDFSGPPRKIDDVWSQNLNINAAGFGADFADPDFHGHGDQLFGEQFIGDEEFRDAAEVFKANASMRDIQEACDNLEQSGVHTGARIPRTSSMSSAGSANVSADSYFLRRSTRVAELELPKSGKDSKKRAKSLVDDEKGSGSNRSTLTGDDISKLVNAVAQSNGKPATRENDRVSKSRLSSSSNSSGRSSISTLAALEELDRIIHDVSSDDDENYASSFKYFCVGKSPQKEKDSFQERRAEILKKVEADVRKAGLLDFPVIPSADVFDQMSSPKPNEPVQSYVEKMRNNLVREEQRAKNGLGSLNSTFELEARTAKIDTKFQRMQSRSLPHKIAQDDVADQEGAKDEDDDVLQRADALLARLNKREEEKRTANTVRPNAAYRPSPSKNQNRKSQSLEKPESSRVNENRYSPEKVHPRQNFQFSPRKTFLQGEFGTERNPDGRKKNQQTNVGVSRNFPEFANGNQNFEPGLQKFESRINGRDDADFRFGNVAEWNDMEKPRHASWMDTEYSVAVEPKSSARAAERCVSRSVQTDFDKAAQFQRRGSFGEQSRHSSLLEQSTYPVGVNAVETRDVALATRQIFFPPTEVGESSTAKLQIKNYTSSTYQLRFSKLELPFEKRYETLNLQPRRYVNVPLRFVPVSTGYFQGEIVVGLEPSGKLHKASMIGEGLPKPNGPGYRN